MMFRTLPTGLPIAKGLSESRGFCLGDTRQPNLAKLISFTQESKQPREAKQKALL